MLESVALGQWSHPQLAYIAVSAGVAGFIRGYSGFGSALAAVPMLTVVLDPVDAVPVVLLFEIALTLGFLPSLIGLVQWRALGWLVPGALIGTPLGLYVLSAVPAEPMRFGLGLLLLGSVLLSWREPAGAGWHLAAPAKLGVGVLSGLLSGATAMSGPPIVLYFLASPVSAAVGRASMMMFFLCSAGIALALGIAADLYARHAFVLAALLLPALLTGAVLGALCFRRSKPATYRRLALATLAAIAVLALGHASVRQWG